MPESVISVNKISKQYFLKSQSQYLTLRDWIHEMPGKFKEDKKNMDEGNFWALKDISFEVKKGEVLGLIGRNGAGKSTLLKILARIVPPTKGSAIIRGNVASILEVGTGFNMELTGRENVYLNGAILGMKRREINNKFREIVDFSGIEKFIDMPVKRYSSGMSVRLAFSVAAHLDSDVILLDEVLAVGDMAFQRKSLKKMEHMTKNEGRTVVFVSHNMPSVSSLCTKAILIEEGKVVKSGETNKVIAEYIEGFVPPEEETNLKVIKARAGNGKIRITDFWMENENGKKVNIVHTGDNCRFVFTYVCPSGKPQKDVDFGFDVSTETGQYLFLHYLAYTMQDLKKCPVKGKMVFKFKKFPLAKGRYKMGLRATVEGVEADYMPRAININVENGDYYHIGMISTQAHSPVYVDGGWILEKAS